MQIDHCRNKTTASKIKVEERGKKAVFLNMDRTVYYRTRVDGCVIKNGPAADWVVTKTGTGDVIVELKGRDVEHAVIQINATAQFWKTNSLFEGKCAGLIVCTQYPRASTTVQRAQQSFAVKFKGPLHVRSKNYEYIFERVLSSDGPF